MQTIYHFESAADINSDILKAIKLAFKEKPVVLTIKEEPAFTIPESQKQIVRKSIKKYKKNPELLINEKDAWKMIDAK